MAMRMFLLDCGVMKFPYSVIARDMEPGADPDMLVPAPIASFLIEHDDGLILFDTGCDPDGLKGHWPEAYRQIPFRESYLPQRLEKLGIKPGDIQAVVASHLHFDHAGCLHLCRNARIYVSQTEWDTTLHAYRNGLDMNAHLASDIRNWMEADLMWEQVPPDVCTRKLADGITILNLGPGHAWGMLGLMVELPQSGPHLLVSDAIYTKMHQGPPPVSPALLSDPEGYRRTIRLIESYASQHRASIVYGHDMEQFTALRAKGGIR